MPGVSGGYRCDLPRNAASRRVPTSTFPPATSTVDYRSSPTRGSMAVSVTGLGARGAAVARAGRAAPEEGLRSTGWPPIHSRLATDALRSGGRGGHLRPSSTQPTRPVGNAPNLLIVVDAVVRRVSWPVHHRVAASPRGDPIGRNGFSALVLRGRAATPGCRSGRSGVGRWPCARHHRRLRRRPRDGATTSHRSRRGTFGPGMRKREEFFRTGRRRQPAGLWPTRTAAVTLGL